MVIDVNDFMNPDLRALVGRNNGDIFISKIEAKYGPLEQLENDANVIEWVFPERLLTINQGFFLQCWSESIRRLGVEGFFNKHRFIIKEHILEFIKESYVHIPLLEATPAQILGVA